MMPLFLWALGAAALLVAASLLLLRSAARFAARARGPASRALPPAPADTPLDRLLAPLMAAHPGQTGLAPLIDARDAFAARSLSAAEAGRSLDLIYYIWRTDTSGWLLMADLFAAAERGVRVRLLLDDVNVQGLDLAFLGLSSHPNIEVRLFNPMRSRGHWLRRGLEFALGLSRFNRRMHGKVWIADNRLAILGGRNIGDAYFAAPGSDERPAHDLDMIIAGPLVEQATEVFDGFWNLGLSLPIYALWPGFTPNIRRFRRRLARHRRTPLAKAYRREALAGRDPRDLLATSLRWTAEATLLADPPDKALGHRRGPWLHDSITQRLLATTHELRLTTPYFVPGAAGLALLEQLARRGVRIRLLTNSLASTDLFTVHAAYSHYRPALLAAGASLYEFAPPDPVAAPPEERPPRRLRSLAQALSRPRAMLHSKVFLMDRSHALVASHNFDLRSANINIEFGLLFREAQSVATLCALFDRQTRPDHAFSVTLHQGRLRWHWADGGTHISTRNEPGAGLPRRLAAALIARLPHGWL